MDLTLWRTVLLSALGHFGFCGSPPDPLAGGEGAAPPSTLHGHSVVTTIPREILSFPSPPFLTWAMGSSWPSRLWLSGEAGKRGDVGELSICCFSLCFWKLRPDRKRKTST